MRVLIYEDNILDLNTIIEYISSFCNKKDIDLEYIVCDSSEKVYQHAISADFIFLDIEGVDANGIEVGVQIRKINFDAKIIFISNYSKYLIDGYKAMACRYFLKPLNKEIFDIEFENIISDYLINNAGFYDSTIFRGKLYYKDIMYVEFINRKTVLVLTSGKKIETNYSLKYWKEKLESFFFSQPYKAYIVNLRQISSITSNEIFLLNNEVIPLSRLYKATFEEDHSESLRRRV